MAVEFKCDVCNKLNRGYVFVLIFQYLDKSDTRVCGATFSPVVANAWRESGVAGSGEHLVYRLEIDSMNGSGFEEWK